MAKILALINGKGGVGKSTTAAHLVVWLHTQGVDVRLIDAAPQQSSSTWLQGRDFPIDVILDPDDLWEKLTDLKVSSQDTWVVVDGPGSIDTSMRAILLTAHHVLIPVRPTSLDLKDLPDTARLVRQAQRTRETGAPTAHVFLSQVQTNSNLYLEAVELFKTSNLQEVIKFIDHPIPFRQLIARIPTEKQTVWDTQGAIAKEAQGFYSQLFTEFMREING